jgi:glutamate-5-semialdehyde dehydrogenase
VTPAESPANGDPRLLDIGRRARTAARQLSRLSTDAKDSALRGVAQTLGTLSAEILAANHADISAAVAAGMVPALLDRLTLTHPRLEAIAADVLTCAGLPDPVGQVFDATVLPSGLRLHKQRVPIGVLAVIYESRPNVTIDVAALAIKTGNAVILRGGSEALASNRALVAAVHHALREADLPIDAVQFIDDPDRLLVRQLLRLSGTIDMVIPRGGAALHDFCRENSTIPVITGGIGICHLFVDSSADLEASLRVIRNAKIQRPTVCNALDTVLVHRAVAERLVPELVARLTAEGVALRADASAWPFLNVTRTEGGGGPRFPDGVTPAGPEDFDTEWLSLVLGVKVVDSLQQAAAHIALHGTGHSDGILTNDPAQARRFVAEVDSSAVYINASTRFTDGAEFGLGTEVAVSTQRLHARGPMGLHELTTYKWVGEGDYLVRS